MTSSNDEQIRNVRSSKRLKLSTNSGSNSHSLESLNRSREADDSFTSEGWVPESVPSIADLLRHFSDPDRSEDSRLLSDELMMSNSRNCRGVVVILPLSLTSASHVNCCRIPLYINDRILGRLSFLRSILLGQDLAGYMCCRPGYGKTTTALLAAASFARDEGRNVLWVELNSINPKLYAHCLHIKPGGEMKSLGVFCECDLKRLIINFGSGSRDLLMVDGVKKDEDKFKRLNVGEWLKQDGVNRRCIITVSFYWGYPLPWDVPALRYECGPWSFEEYRCAIMNRSFVKVLRNQGMEEFTENRYFYSGGHPRLMFDKSCIEKVKIEIEDAVYSRDQDLAITRYSDQPSLISRYAIVALAETISRGSGWGWIRAPLVGIKEAYLLAKLFGGRVDFIEQETGNAIAWYTRPWIHFAVQSNLRTQEQVWAVVKRSEKFQIVFWEINTIKIIIFEHSNRINFDLAPIRDFVLPMKYIKHVKIYIVKMFWDNVRILSVINSKALKKYGWPTDEQGVVSRIQILHLI